jgi:ATP-dependent helicase/nuclease subunit B
LLPVHHFPLDARHNAQAFWLRLAETATAWLDSRGLAVRDAVLLVPFAQHLTPARRAWMQLSRWQPRIETTHSLASAMGPSALPQAQQISFDAAIDGLAARALLQSQSWAQALRSSDARAFELAIQRLVETAHAWARTASQRSPLQRELLWEQGRLALQSSGPGGLERALALVALEWAAADTRSPATDVLFDLRPSAWLQLQCGGPDPLSEALLSHAEAAGLPCLRLSADLALDQAFEHSAPLGPLTQALCDDFEDLAQCSAAAVLQHLHAGRSPVALIAQDRVLIRRVRALLERRGVGIADETGWTLATTPPAAQLMALLRAARGQASLDEWLAFLKTALAARWREQAGSAALAALEARCRTRGWSSPLAVRVDVLSPSSARLWRSARQGLAPLSEGPALRSLADWLAALGELLRQMGGDAVLEAQEAGGPLLDALWLRRSPWPDSAHEAVLQQAQLSQAEFLAWVDASLEAAQYVPPPLGEVTVMITPLARVMLRPFGAIVLPGADAQTLGPVPAGPALLSDGLARQLGLPTIEDKRAAQALTFAQLLRAPALTLLRCRSKGSEPLAASPLLERLALALQAAGHAGIGDWRDERAALSLQPQPMARAQAQFEGLLPAALSASAVDSLRNCPYQFFARVLLGLREQAELEAEADKRDYGTWLHAVLYQFHQERLVPAGESADEEDGGDETRLQRAAAAQMQALGLSPAEFLPFSAGFARFVPRYLAWLREQEAAGVRYAAGELEREVLPYAEGDAVLQDLRLRGRLDRIDVSGDARLLLDYKTGSVKGLKDKVAEPAEDTQLAVYAALMQGAAEPAGPPGLQALYLALDDAKGIADVPHPDVADSADLLLWGLKNDLLDLHGGAPMPALGEGMACAYCEMRGLCRRDDWAGVAL